MDENLLGALRRIEEKIDSLREDLGSHGSRIAVVETRIGDIDRRVTKVEAEGGGGGGGGKGIVGAVGGGASAYGLIELINWLLHRGGTQP